METIDNTLIKYDILSVEALDKIHSCLDLLVKDNRIEKKESLKETYEDTIGIYKLERDNPEMWKMCWEHKIMSLFQMEKQSGISGIETLKPSSVDELAILNSTIRLMAQEKGGEMPTEKLARFKKNPELWVQEMESYGVSKENQNVLKSILDISYGLCIAQEQFMQLVQLPELGGFDLTWADSLRKSIAKKNPAAYEALTKEFFEVTKEKGCDENLCKYTWNVLIAMSRGYGFNQSHTLAYSLIGLQEMNLAFNFPIIYWNCACLISDSGGQVVEEKEYVEIEDEEESEEKKKNSSVDYGKIATAIGQMQSEGIQIYPPDINKSVNTFSPDVESNRIIYGIKGISRIGDDLVDKIIKNRPYESWQDFISKVKVNKTQMINLIKSGAFDIFDNREKIMKQYILSISDQKKRLTLQNMTMLINYGLLPKELEKEVKIFNFNKYLKKNKYNDYYNLDSIAFPFYEENFNVDFIKFEGDLKLISQSRWDSIYKNAMNPVRDYLKENGKEILDKLNETLYYEAYDKNADGNISKWEMDSVSYYYHEHELQNINTIEYDLSDFNKLDENPIVNNVFYKGDKPIVLYKLNRIAGTVLDKDKSKNTITLLTTTGVVKVKIYRPQFTKYDKQISMKLEDGTKKVIEKSWFTRGNKLIVTGIRRGNEFVPKIYKNSPYKTPFFLIEDINEFGEVTGLNDRIEI